MNCIAGIFSMLTGIAILLTKDFDSHNNLCATIFMAAGYICLSIRND